MPLRLVPSSRYKFKAGRKQSSELILPESQYDQFMGLVPSSSTILAHLGKML